MHHSTIYLFYYHGVCYNPKRWSMPTVAWLQQSSQQKVWIMAGDAPSSGRGTPSTDQWSQLSFLSFLFFYACIYIANTLKNYFNYHILDILGHGSKCLDIMGLDILGLARHSGNNHPTRIQVQENVEVVEGWKNS